jgi:cytidylate kinase
MEDKTFGTPPIAHQGQIACQRQAPIIAIDGPAGTGKSTLALRLATYFRWQYIDSGAMYRAVALCAAEQGLP